MGTLSRKLSSFAVARLAIPSGTCAVRVRRHFPRPCQTAPRRCRRRFSSGFGMPASSPQFARGPVEAVESCLAGGPGYAHGRPDGGSPMCSLEPSRAHSPKAPPTHKGTPVPDLGPEIGSRAAVVPFIPASRRPGPRKRPREGRGGSPALVRAATWESQWRQTGGLGGEPGRQPSPSYPRRHISRSARRAWHGSPAVWTREPCDCTYGREGGGGRRPPLRGAPGRKTAATAYP